ncbi:MAG: hypothetical protein OXD42_05090 [Rhodospirillaceae bacterium]|nr:hypothetical protein [Rhodospirillaceae bacterium]
MTAKRQFKPNLDVFDETKRDPVTIDDMEKAFKQIMQHSSKPKKKSKNREPTMDELNQRWKLKRA